MASQPPESTTAGKSGEQPSPAADRESLIRRLEAAVSPAQRAESLEDWLQLRLRESNSAAYSNAESLGRLTKEILREVVEARDIYRRRTEELSRWRKKIGDFENEVAKNKCLKEIEGRLSGLADYVSAGDGSRRLPQNGAKRT